ncbi:MAG TPA: pyridoxal-phosphate dependent enzyme [Acetobacteraceae bacterium]|jgi:threonine dehydratase|nr:pyridoxal-phosphate dependent enzyme [Acetobacteraceae bacterium]
MTETEIDGIAVPTSASIAATRAALAPHIATTPVMQRDDMPGLDGITAQFKFELLQHSGTFKARGAFANLLALSPEARARGVTAISAGNHAIAVAYAAMRLGVSAKVVMIRTASPARVALVHRYGAELLLAEDGASGFAMVRRIEADEGRSFVHPFNGLNTILGTATLGAEWAEQSARPDQRGLDAVVLPIGGGGLAAGAATALKLALPKLAIYGVEPEGADGMAQSFRANGPLKLGHLSGIADSLMAPHTEAYSYGLCHRALDGLVTVSDAQLRAAMALLFAELKLAVEPACAAATAAALGPLRQRLAGKRVGLLLCGSNTDAATFTGHLAAA